MPRYDEALLLREMRLFPEWYIGRHLNITLSAAPKRQAGKRIRAHCGK